MQNHGRPRNGANRRCPKLKRLPRDFSWRVLSSVFGCLSHELPDQFRCELGSALRERDPVSYHGLADRWGLQCIPLSCGVLPPYKMAIVQLLVYLAKKDPTFETKSPAERREAVFSGILLQEERCLRAKPSECAVLNRARYHVRRLLGAAPDIDLWSLGCRHGPGSSIDIPYACRSAYFKYAQWPYLINPEARDMLRVVIESDERWLGSLEDSYRERYRIQKWARLDWDAFWTNVFMPLPVNKITTVPKDGTKDRPIAIEPAGNIYLQLGIESVIRRALAEDGNDLDDQTRNQRLAQIGSEWPGPLAPATIDLSNASDSVSLQLVEALLPPRWFDLLVKARSPWGELPDGRCLRYAKISSMGNGYTFALESLVFYVLCLAISDLYGCPYYDKRTISAYGDDIVIPEYLGRHVCAYLENWGFTVNHRKSFLKGPVKESCGCDFYYGHNIRGPRFSEDGVRDVMDLLSLRNRLHRWFSLVLGASLPTSVDELICSYIEGKELVPAGPESDEEFDTWIHTFKLWPEYLAQRRLLRKTPEIPGRDLRFRKLMHNLRGNSESGNRFEIRSSQAGNIRISVNTVRGSYYIERPNGVEQNYVRLPYGSARAEPSRGG